MPSATDPTISPPSKVKATPGAFPEQSDNEQATITSSQHSLAQAVHARRAEYTRAQSLRIKVGTWNVASLSGTEKDIEGWFVDGKGVSASLAGLDLDPTHGNTSTERNGSEPEVESVAEQEARRTKKHSTIPKNDQGALPGGEEIGLYALGLQEVVDISSATEALRPYTDPAVSRKWRYAVGNALPRGYELVAEQQLIGLLLLVYASPKVAPMVSSVSTTSVGTGVMGYMGNKGAVTARLLLGETTRLVFINSHLAAGIEKGSVERRNWDAAQILSRTKFDAVSTGERDVEDTSEVIGDEDFAFWFGDLNYRLEGLPGEDVRRLLMLHTRNEYDIGQRSEKKIEKELSKASLTTVHGATEIRERSSTESSASSNAATLSSSVRTSSTSTTLNGFSDEPDPNADPTSLQTTLSSLLPHDELHQQQRARKAFHDGWREGPINFLPTYKYDAGSVGMFDSGDKRRGPSWCDRVLYRTRRDRLEYLKEIKKEQTAREKDEEMKARGIDKADDEDVLFDYDPETDGDSYEYDETTEPDVVVTRDGFEDTISLDYYTSHQRVLSSDHKPLDAVFTLSLEAVVPELKAKIHQEVARELDRAENEGRPVVTIVVDRRHDTEGVDFGDVKYDHIKFRGITIANTGRVPATFSFVDRSDGVCPPWLSLHVHGKEGREYTIEPGDAVNMTLELRIKDTEHLRSLNEGRSKIEDVLVLRVMNGRDHFLPIRANWVPSSFGRSIDKLIRIPEGGVRRLQHQRPDSGTEQGVKWSAPRELFRLTESIEELVERSVAEWCMMDGGDVGWPFARETWTLKDLEKRREMGFEVREALDEDRSVDFGVETTAVQRLEVLVETLVEFLESLEDGVVTEGLWAELEKGVARKGSDEEERTWVLDVLSTVPTHNICFVFLTAMLSHVANEIAPLHRPADISVSPKAKGRARALSHDPMIAKRQQVDRAFAAIFANAIIRAPVPNREKEKRTQEERKREVVEVFLRAKPE
ncbi:MAG: hypothetical protein M1812_006745 [Candelaria pacifica]|nr:MAG: hypothetical protein M1812_006745 [Candelaria pacifica]